MVYYDSYESASEQRANHQSRSGSRWGQTQIMRSLILAGHLAPGYAEISKPRVKAFQEAKIMPLLQPHMQLGLLRSCLQDLAFYWNNSSKMDQHFHRLVPFSDLDWLVEFWCLNPQLTQTTETCCFSTIASLAVHHLALPLVSKSYDSGQGSLVFCPWILEGMAFTCTCSLARRQDLTFPVFFLDLSIHWVVNQKLNLPS